MFSTGSHLLPTASSFARIGDGPGGAETPLPTLSTTHASGAQAMSDFDSTAIPSGFHCDPETGVCYRELSFLGFPGYRVGDDGSVWSAWKRGGKGRGSVSLGVVWKILSPKTDSNGRHNYTLCCPSHKDVRPQVLVLLAFVGPCPEGMEGCHWDGNPANNNVWNLRWATHKDNMKDRTRHGRTYQGTAHHSAVLNPDLVRSIRTDAEQDQTRGRFARIGKKYGVTKGLIRLIVLRKIWKSVA